MAISPQSTFLRVLFILVCFLSFINNQARTRYDTKTSLTGTVITSDGQPAPGVSVFLVELQQVAITSTNGDFSFKNIPAGEYHLEVSILGFEKITRTVTLTAEQALHVTIALK